MTKKKATPRKQLTPTMKRYAAQEKFSLLDIVQLLAEFESLARQDAVKPLKDGDVIRMNKIRMEIVLRNNVFFEEAEAEVAAERFPPGPADDPFRGIDDDGLNKKIKQMSINPTDPEIVIRMFLELLLRDFERIKFEPEYMQASDQNKVNYFLDAGFKTDTGVAVYRECYKEIFNKYPIITKYMVCRSLFHHEALRLWLKKCAYFRQSPDAYKMDKEESHCHLQAIYARMLYEKLAPGHYSGKDKKEIYDATFRELMKDYKDFGAELAAAEDAIKVAERENAAGLVEDLIDRVDELDEEQRVELLGLIQHQTAKQNFEAGVLPELEQRIKEIAAEQPAVEGGYGQSQSGTYENEIRMRRKGRHYTKKTMYV